MKTKQGLLADIGGRIETLWNQIPNDKKVLDDTLTAEEAYRLGQLEAWESVKKMIKDVDICSTWSRQLEDDIYKAVKPWDVYRFVCLMVDGTLQFFIGSCDETSEGEINVHIDCLNDNYDIDGIVFWMKVPFSF